jgi:hypothetical protein
LAEFTDWVRFDDLPDADVPSSPGVYTVVRPATTPPSFLDTSPAGWFKGKDPTVPRKQLAAAWVPGESIVYIGKATRLRRPTLGRPTVDRVRDRSTTA